MQLRMIPANESLLASTIAIISISGRENYKMKMELHKHVSGSYFRHLDIYTHSQIAANSVDNFPTAC